MAESACCECVFIWLDMHACACFMHNCVCVCKRRHCLSPTLGSFLGVTVLKMCVFVWRNQDMGLALSNSERFSWVSDDLSTLLTSVFTH